jgi:hypothetical protein
MMLRAMLSRIAQYSQINKKTAEAVFVGKPEKPSPHVQTTIEREVRTRCIATLF